MNPGDPEDTMLTKQPNTKAPLIVLGAALLISLAANVALLMQPEPPPDFNHAEVACPPADVVCPPATECPACQVCAVCTICPDAGVAAAPTGPGTPRPPRVDEGAAAEGEGHLQHAENTGELDPVQVAAQRRLADGIDRIVASHSPAAATRFITRNLPAFSSMNCAFRDPAAAEHVRMKLRELDAVRPANQRLTEEQLVRFERDLRCPRE
jgi:hypothetical protein